MLRALIALLAPVGAIAQVICALGSGAASYQPSADERPSGDALQLAQRMNTAAKAICGTNCPEVALLRNSTSPNAILILDAGNAKLVYAPQFFAAIYAASGDAGIMAIIAHELGHALDDALGARWVNAKWTPELRADSWAGCLLAKSDLSAAGLKAALAALAKNPPSSHPAWSLRLPPLRAGFTSCGGDRLKFDAAVPAVVQWR